MFKLNSSLVIGKVISTLKYLDHKLFLSMNKDFGAQVKRSHQYYYEQLIYVKVEDIKWGTNNPAKFAKDMREDVLFVKSGNWDTYYKTPILEYTKQHRSCRTTWEIFVEQIHYKDSSQYRSMINKVKSGMPVKGCYSEEDVKMYFDDLLTIYQNIKTYGYKTQDALDGSKKNEIRVYIDRHGEFMLGSEGNHRYMIAKILNLNKIPVIVKGIHYLWAKKCYDYYNNRNLLKSIQEGLRNMDRSSQEDFIQ